MKRLAIVGVWCLLITQHLFGYHLQPGDTTLANRYYKLADADSTSAKDALNYLQKASAIYRDKNIWDRYIDCLNFIASITKSQGDTEKAIEMIHNAITLAQSKLGPNSLQEGYSYRFLGIHYYSSSDTEQALKYFLLAENIMAQSKKTAPMKLTTLYQYMAVLYQDLKDYDRSEKYFFKALPISIKEEGPDHLHIAWLYNNIGQLFLDRGYYDDAIHYVQLARAIKEKQKQYLATTYGNLSICYFYRGDYDMALQYVNKTLSIKDLSEHDRSRAYNNLGIIYHEMEQYEKALNCYKKTITCNRQITDLDPISKAFPYHNTGIVMKEVGSFDSAVYYCMKALKMWGTKDPSYTSRSYHSLGSIYSDRNEYNSASLYFEKALNLRQTMYGSKHPDLGHTYLGIADLQLKQRHYHKALKNYQYALCSQVVDYNDTSIYSHAPLKKFLKPDLYLEIYAGKAHAFEKLFSVTKNRTDLMHSLEVYVSCDSLIDNIRQSHLSHSDKIKVGKKAKEIYEGAIQVCLDLHQLTKDQKYLNQAFHFSERSKTGVLLLALSDISAKNFAKVPSDLLSLEKKLKIDISYFESQIQEKKSTPSSYDSATVRSLEDKLFFANRSFDSLVLALEKNFPQYYRLKYRNDVIKLQELQKQLDVATAVIEYFVGDSSTFIFTVTSNGLICHTLKSDTSLNHLTRELRNTLNPKHGYVDPAGTYSRFTNSAKAIHSTYFKPAMEGISGIEKLIIIPDGQLGYIPFDVLIPDTTNSSTMNYHTLPYLLHTYRISYAYSSTLLFEERFKKSGRLRPTYIAFAPVYENKIPDSTQLLALGKFRDQVTTLAWNGPEVSGISKYLNGVSLLGTDAVESKFKTSAGQYGIVHLAMHALIDDERPMYSKLVFSDKPDGDEDGFLNAYELYNMELPNDLVVLSACETGYGKLEEGEGIMSLARAFAYAGCPSIVMSHWVADDEATARLMDLFYKYLAAGLSKDEALQKAKIEFLTREDVLKQNPAFWAGFVVLGDTSPINMSTNWQRYWIYILLSAVVFILVVYFLAKKRTRLHRPQL